MKRLFTLIAFLLWASLAHAAGALMPRTWSAGFTTHGAATSGNVLMPIGTWGTGGVGAPGQWEIPAASNDLLIVSFGHGSTITNGTNTSGCTSFVEQGTSGIFKIRAGLISVTSGQASCNWSNATNQFFIGWGIDFADSDGTEPIVDALSPGIANSGGAEIITDTVTTTHVNDLVLGVFINDASSLIANADPWQQGQIAGYVGTWGAWTYLSQAAAGVSLPQAVIAGGSGGSFTGFELAIAPGDAGTHNTVGTAPAVGIYHNWTTGQASNGTSIPSVAYSAPPVSPPVVPTGAQGAITFDGATTYLTSNTPQTFPSSGSYTFIRTFKTTTSSAHAVLGEINNNQNGGGTTFNLGIAYIASGKIHINGCDASNCYDIGGTASYNDGNPHRIYTVWNTTAGTETLYIDGSQVAQQTGVGAPRGQTGYFLIGTGNFYSGGFLGPQYFQGTIGETAYIPTALRSAQISTLDGHASDGQWDATLKSYLVPGSSWWKLNDLLPASGVADYYGSYSEQFAGTLYGQLNVPVHLVDISTISTQAAITGPAGMTSRATASIGNASTYAINIADASETASGNYGPFTATASSGVGNYFSALVPLNPTGPGDTVASASGLTGTCAASPCSPFSGWATPTAGHYAIIVATGSWNQTTNQRAIYAPAGWQVLTSFASPPTMVWGKVTDGTETSPSFTFSGSITAASFSYSEWSGVNTASSFVLAPITATAVYPTHDLSVGEPVVVELAMSAGLGGVNTYSGLISSLSAPSYLGSTLFNLQGTNSQVDLRVWCHAHQNTDPATDSWAITPDANEPSNGGSLGVWLQYLTFSYSAGCVDPSSQVLNGFSLPLGMPNLSISSPGGYFALWNLLQAEGGNNSQGMGGWISDKLNDANTQGNFGMHLATMPFAAGSTGVFDVTG